MGTMVMVDPGDGGFHKIRW